MDRLAIAMIVGSNVLTLAIALKLRWPLLLLMIPYWVQSVVIGWYSARRILKLDRFSTEGTSGFEGDSPEEVKLNTVKFFAMHYGLFHFVYLFFMFVFVISGKMPGSIAVPEMDWGDLAWIAASSAMFALTHRASFKRNLEHDRKGCPNIGTLMFLPYARVLPMHLTIILGLSMGYSGAVLFFGLLKTAADVLMHYVEHSVLAQEK
jgi:hypothetical protein